MEENPKGISPAARRLGARPASEMTVREAFAAGHLAPKGGVQ
jgi:hypothetical protein